MNWRPDDTCRQRCVLCQLSPAAIQCMQDAVNSAPLPSPPLPVILSSAAYRSAGQWRMAFALASKAGWGAEQLRRMATGLVDDLASGGRAAEAAALSLEYLQNVDSAGGGRGS